MAAFINAIAEEGTKDEAVKWLQKTWDELMEVKVENAKLREALEEYAKIEGPPYHGTPFLARAALQKCKLVGNMDTLTAIRDIAPGEELTLDYASFGGETDFA